MSSKVPVVRQVAWLSVLPQFAVMGGLILMWYFIGVERYVFNGALNYLLISIPLRSILTRFHRKGMRKVKRENYADAILDFQKSIEFFTKYSWIDKYRFLFLLSSSRMAYREMAFNNIAFCYGQTGNGEKAIEYYELTLREYPGSGMAKVGLQMLKSVKSSDAAGEQQLEDITPNENPNK